MGILHTPVRGVRREYLGEGALRAVCVANFMNVTLPSEGGQIPTQPKISLGFRAAALGRRLEAAAIAGHLKIPLAARETDLADAALGLRDAENGRRASRRRFFEDVDCPTAEWRWRHRGLPRGRCLARGARSI